MEISKPIKKDGREHREYVPTQVIAEYFRYMFAGSEHESGKILGIIFCSAQTFQKNITLFLSPPSKLDQRFLPDDATEHLLALENTSLIRVE